MIANGIYLSAGIALVGLVGLWLTNGRNLPQAGYRDAARAMELNAPASLGLCAFGADAEVFRYYAHMPVTIIRSLDDFIDWAQDYTEVRCGYLDASWGPPGTEAIHQLLAASAQAQTFGGVIVYTLQRTRPK